MKENNTINTNISSTPYDDVFRTLINDCTWFVLPLLNEVFDEHYDGTEKIITANDYHFQNMQDGRDEKLITDSSFRVLKGMTEKKYHLECQSTIDNSMVLRFFEYDSQIALENAEVTENKLILTFPHSAVLFLRSNKNTKDVMEICFKIPCGEISYKIPIIKMQRYSLQDIWDKELYILIPFYIFTHEAHFQAYNSNNNMLQKLMNEFSDICKQLEKLADLERISELEKRTIIELSKKVVDNIARKYNNITEGVDHIMGGKVIETEAKKIYNRGMEQGLERGLEQGLERGIEQGLERGIIEGRIETLYIECHMSVPEIAKKISKSEDYVQKVIERLS